MGDPEKWVRETLAKMTVEEKVGQMIVPSFESDFMSTDSKAFDDLVRSVHELKVGGFHMFGASEPVPNVLLNPTYGSVTLGRPLEAASIVNRLQAIAPIPLLNTADFETGVGFRIAGATTFPRLMAFGAARVARTLLFGVAPGDPWALTLAVAVLVCAALLAAAGPAWQATRVDPSRTLKQE